MTGRRLFGIILCLIGAAFLLYGIAGALTELGGLYSQTMNDALGAKDGAEQAASAAMWSKVKIGAIGIPFMLAGSLLLRAFFFRRFFRF